MMKSITLFRDYGDTEWSTDFSSGINVRDLNVLINILKKKYKSIKNGAGVRFEFRNITMLEDSGAWSVHYDIDVTALEIYSAIELLRGEKKKLARESKKSKKGKKPQIVKRDPRHR